MIDSSSPLYPGDHFECPIGQSDFGCEIDDQEDSGRGMRRQRGIRKGKFENKNPVIKEGGLYKHSKTTLKKGTYRNFKLYKNALYYSRLKEETEDNLIDIIGASIAERGTRNTSHTFSVTTDSRTLFLSAESRRDMEDWMRKIRSCAEKRIDKEDLYNTQTLSGLHNWCLATHSRPIFCSKCREVLPGNNYRGVTCEVCGIKAHQACGSGVTQACKWTTKQSMERDGVKLYDKSLHQPHQWLEGNLPSNSKCLICTKSCGSKKSLQDWSCIWCRLCCHDACKSKAIEHCDLGKNKKLILPAQAAGEVTSYLNWKIIDSSFNFNPFLAFVNSRSGDNQGVKFVRRLRSLLNPLQVIDLGVTTPEPALEVYKECERFQIMACGGDGTIGWILQCLDKFNLHKKASTLVVPLGTGNDLSRVLGWGAACNDDAKLEGILEDVPKCTIRQLDRWSVAQCSLIMSTMSIRKRARAKAMESSPKPSRKLMVQEDKKEKAKVIREITTEGRTPERRRSSTGESDQTSANEFLSIKRAMSLPNITDIELPSSTGHVTYAFEETLQFGDVEFSDKFDDGEFTGTVPTMLISSLSQPKGEKEKVLQIAEVLASLLEQLCSDLVKGYPVVNKMDLGIASKVCNSLKDWTISFLETMRKHMQKHEVEASLVANKANLLLADLQMVINSISKVSPKKSKYYIPESEVLVRCSCCLLVVHNTNLTHLEGDAKSQFTSLVMGLLLNASQANEIKRFTTTMEKKFKEFDYEASNLDFNELTKRKSSIQEFKDITTMNNYIGIGLDAKIALDFHNLREEHPEQCKTRAQNKMWYGVFTGRQMVSKEFKNLSQRLTLECDGEVIELPQLQGIVLLNIPSYMAGTNFWGTDKESGAFQAPSFDDKKLEVIAVMGTTHMAESKMFGVQRHRLAQAETVKLTIHKGRKLPVQVDGEAWLQDPGVIVVRHKNKARMLVYNKKKSINSNLSDPQLIERNFSISGEFHNRPSNQKVSELVEAVERLLETIKSLIQSKKAEFQKSVDKELIQAHQENSYKFLQAYGPDGQVMVQGMHQVKAELISSAKSLAKETMLYLALSDTGEEMKRMMREALDPVIKQLKTLMN